MIKRKQQRQTFIKGNASHSRTEADYMSTLLEAVTLEDWQTVVTSTVVAAKQGDAQARAWLGQYLVGKPAGKAPTPLTVVVQQLNGENPLVNRLSQRIISHHNNPFADDKKYRSWKRRPRQSRQGLGLILMMNKSVNLPYDFGKIKWADSVVVENSARMSRTIIGKSIFGAGSMKAY